MSNYTIRLDTENRQRWLEHCKSHGIVGSVAIRSFIDSQISGAPTGSAQTPLLEPVAEASPKRSKQRLTSVSVRLTESEHEQIRLRKRLVGCTKTAWIVRTIRAALTRSPVLDEEQTEAVKESNYQLLVIGKNINQIARRLNERQDSQAKALELAELQSIKADIDAHVNRISCLINTVTERGALS